MKVEELEKYGAKLEMPKDAMKEQSKIMLRALRRKFGIVGMLGVFKDLYFFQRKLRKDVLHYLLKEIKKNTNGKVTWDDIKKEL